MTVRSIRLFQTAEHPCGYFRERQARDLMLDPHEPALAEIYGQALAAGFRRSGGHVYRPHCVGCAACRPLRVEVAGFRPNRSQRRCLRRNQQVRLEVTGSAADDTVYGLYRRYLAHRHAGGGMDGGDRFDFEHFVACDWSPTRFFRLLEGDRLLAVAVTDVVAGALSAVYTFFEPELPERGLGTLAILRQIDWARQHGLAHLYLGFWIPEHAKMRYKATFAPADVLRDGRWVRLPPSPLATAS